MYKETKTIKLKQRNFIGFVSQYTDDEGNPLPLEGLDINAELRDSGKQLIATFTVNILDSNNGLFELSLPTDTEITKRTLYTDILISEEGIKRNSDILKLDFSEVVTYG